MQAKMKIKKGDKVIVITGKDKGKTGFVKKVLLKENRLVVEGVNVVTKHQRPSPAQPGGVVKQEASIHASNVSYYDEAKKSASRVGFKLEDGARKVRVSRKSGNVIEA